MTAAATTRWALKDQLIFPEIDYNKVEKTKGMNICITTTAKTDAEGLALLRHHGHAVPAVREWKGFMATTAKIAKDQKLAKAKAAKMPKLQCRHRNRCFRCGRPRGFLRKFKLCRICFRKLALAGRDSRRDQGELVDDDGREDDEANDDIDPIADMLTRSPQCASLRATRKWTCRHRRLKTEIARILKEEGYILNFKPTEEGAKKYIRIYLKYTPGNVAGDLADRACSRPGLPRVCRAARKCRACWAAWESIF